MTLKECLVLLCAKLQVSLQVEYLTIYSSMLGHGVRISSARES